MTGREYAMMTRGRDIVPHEVVDVLSNKTLVVREMICDLSPQWRPRMVMGQCINQDEQAWEISPDEKAVPFRIRWSQKHGWRDREGHSFKLGGEPLRWHRYDRIGGD